MAFKPMGTIETKKKGNAVKAKDVPLGTSYEGYLMDFIKTDSKYSPDPVFSPKLVSESGEETVIWASGNLKYLKKDCDDQGIKLGTYVRLTRKEPREGAKIQVYFEREIDSTRVKDGGGSDY